MKNTTYLILAFLVCQLSFSKVTVDPVMPALPNISVCDDNNDGMASFNLSSQDAYIISGQSSMPSNYIVTYHLTLLDANNGLNPISSTSYLGSNGQVIYARIINIATGFFAVGPFSLMVNPKPIISNIVTVICSGSTFSIMPTNTPISVVPMGTTYTWTAPVITPVGSVVGGSAQATPQTSISQMLTNYSSVNATATYTVTATSPGGCTSTFMMVVQINSRPIISNKSVSICSGSTFNVTPTNTLPDVVPIGTTYTWTSPVISSSGSVIGGSANVLPQTSISQTLTNPTSSNATATYTVNATSGAAPNTCSSVFTITVTIKPTVSVTVPSNILICNGDLIPASVFSSNLPGTTYTWTNSNSAIGLGNSGTGNISSFIALNTLNTSISSTITVTPFNNGCLGTPSSYTITVLPSVNLPFFPNVTTCDSYTLPSLSVGNYFTAPNGTGTMMSAGTVITSTQMIYIHASNGVCTAEESFLVTVLPSVNPIITGTNDSNIVYVDYPTETVVQPLLLTATTSFTGTLTYQWYLNGMLISGATNPTFLVDTFAIPDEPRTFSVIVSSFFGCTGMSSFVVIQTAVPAPFGLSSQTFTPGQTLANLVVTGTNILWYSTLTGRNTTSTPLPSNTLLVDGVTYYATQTINGYESPTRLAVTVHSTLSNDSFGIVDFKYSPNPVNDYLFIQAKETIKIVTVYNALGQLVLSQNGNTMELKLDLSQLKSGNYFVKTQSDLKQNNFKIIKK